MREEIEDTEESGEADKLTAVDENEVYCSQFAEDDNDSGEETATSSWRDDILDNCLRWLDDLQETPLLVETEEQPDLYSFYEELCVLRNEFKKNSRRSHETFLKFGEHLGEFDGVMASLAQRLENSARDQENMEFLARQQLLLQIVEIHERMRRFEEKLREIKSPPRAPEAARPGLWARMLGRDAPEGGKGKRKDRKKQREQTERQVTQDIPANVIDGFFLTMSHFDEFLVIAGVRRTATAGAPFDPSVMMAVGVVATDACLPNTVVEEISSGYLYGNNVLKLAKVTVSKQKEQ